MANALDDAKLAQHLGCDRLWVLDQGEKDVLRADGTAGQRRGTIGDRPHARCHLDGHVVALPLGGHAVTDDRLTFTWRALSTV